MGTVSVHSARHLLKKLYLVIVENGYLDDIGNVAAEDLDILPIQCGEAKTTKREFKTSTTHYEEIFTIAALYGFGFYHAFIEETPRMAPYLEFLLKNPNIKIHVVHINNHNNALDFLPVLGIDKKRIIYGPVHGNILYVPQGGGCGWLNPLPGQILANKFHSHLRGQITGETAKPRNILLLIFRFAYQFTI